jgi:hypothetical protein
LQICHRCRWHRWCTLTCEYLRKFSKKFEMILTLLSGAWGKVIHEKNLKQKILWHCPFKGTVRPDWICMRVVPLERPGKGHQPHRFLIF